jgi:hypothetical protein
MEVFRDNTAEFSYPFDNDLGRWSVSSATRTFDRKAARLPGFELV